MNRVSLGAQSFRPQLLRRARPRCPTGRRPARRALIFVMPDLTTSRSTSSTGSPARAPADLEADLGDALALEPEHLSCYELEAKPGTRFTHAHGEELARQAEAMESYFELRRRTLTGAGLPLVRDGELLPRRTRGGRDLRSRHNLAYWLGRDYLGLGIGAVSTIDGAALAERAAARRATSRRSRAARGRRARSKSSTTDVRAARARDARAPARRAARARGLAHGARPRALARLERARARRATTRRRRSRSPRAAAFSAAGSRPSCSPSAPR